MNINLRKLIHGVEANAELSGPPPGTSNRPAGTELRAADEARRREKPAARWRRRQATGFNRRRSVLRAARGLHPHTDRRGVHHRTTRIYFCTGKQLYLNLSNISF